ncbi:unnamed protein product [Acanthoscelides obtectus]|uniref:Uncharacterized protein n=1 Tax=Acanthoscelides obtectus TaxID=200917 RepID=A0A9P0KSS9_ACAOB|nr:unnamed protein product [Acanthoscelides obtectus]CAK1654833.1 hypothetical protein AOBTE_LOCUS18882 [Acanthoscelides obtectus]
MGLPSTIGGPSCSVPLVPEDLKFSSFFAWGIFHLFFCLPLDPRNSAICRILLSSAALFARRNHVKNPTRHHLGFSFWGNIRYWRSIDTFSTGDLFPNRDPFSTIGILTSSVLKPSSPILN